MPVDKAKLLQQTSITSSDFNSTAASMMALCADLLAVEASRKRKAAAGAKAVASGAQDSDSEGGLPGDATESAKLAALKSAVCGATPQEASARGSAGTKKAAKGRPQCGDGGGYPEAGAGSSPMSGVSLKQSRQQRAVKLDSPHSAEAVATSRRDSTSSTSTQYNSSIGHKRRGPYFPGPVAPPPVRRRVSPPASTSTQQECLTESPEQPAEHQIRPQPGDSFGRKDLLLASSSDSDSEDSDDEPGSKAQHGQGESYEEWLAAVMGGGQGKVLSSALRGRLAGSLPVAITPKFKYF